MPDERNQDVERMLAGAADRTRSARAELSAAALDLFQPPEQRLTDQQRAIMRDLLVKLVGAIELELRHGLVDDLGRDLPALAVRLGTQTEATAYERLVAAGSLRDPALLRHVVQRADEHRLMLTAVDEAPDAPAGPNLLEALARSPDPELARRAVAYVVVESKRRDRFREPLLLRDDLPERVAIDLHWRVAAALRTFLLDDPALDGARIEVGLEAAVRRALADHNEGQGAYPRALRLAARLHELDELSDEFLRRSLVQGHLALFAAGLATRADVGIDAVWPAIADRGRSSLLVLLRAIDMSAAAAAAIVETLENGQPLARSPSAWRALLAAFETLEIGAAERLVRRWRLDPGFRHAIDDLEAGR